jgi:hypothetical protein
MPYFSLVHSAEILVQQTFLSLKKEIKSIFKDMPFCAGLGDYVPGDNDQHESYRYCHYSGCPTVQKVAQLCKRLPNCAKGCPTVQKVAQLCKRLPNCAKACPSA